ncbi:Transcriptional regulator, XRE family [Alkalibacterium sp. AK22]|uniref:helix-turn-helix domain-containing protein n=1 Tax=Alkalibacterium sp. AK22 TaxID=1229520 RepID=UPI000447C86D|nr:helix-turn-helix transcriptional regulator [Alkalibacterium sp. AK22]EXJ24418.1 Transcriptional regulator, XRE family [Alkalibacterium sp. AK22]
MEVNKKQLGKRIKDIRVNSCNSTMEEFGNLVGAGKSNVSRWERGENIPNDLTLKKIAELGNISVEYLLYGDVREYFYNVIYENSKEFTAKLGEKSPLKLFNAFYDTIGKALESGSPYYPEPDDVLQMFHTFIDSQQKGFDKLMLAYHLNKAKRSANTTIELMEDSEAKTNLEESLKEINEAVASYESYFNTSIDDQILYLIDILEKKE